MDIAAHVSRTADVGAVAHVFSFSERERYQVPMSAVAQTMEVGGEFGVDVFPDEFFEVFSDTSVIELGWGVEGGAK